MNMDAETSLGATHSSPEMPTVAEGGVWRKIFELLQTGCMFMAQLRATELRGFEAQPEEEAVQGMRKGALRGIAQAMGEAIGVLAKASALVPVPQSSPAALLGGEVARPASDGLDIDDICFDLVDDNAVPAHAVGSDDRLIWENDRRATENTSQEDEAESKATLGRFFEELDLAIDEAIRDGNHPASVDPEELLSLCSVLIPSLEREQGRLQGLLQRGSKWRLISAGEEARRHTLRALRAVLSGLRTLLLEHCDASWSAEVEALEIPGLDEVGELKAALAVRTALLFFRRDTLQITAKRSLAAKDGEILRQCLIATQARLAMLLGTPIYAEIRVADRAELQQFRERILEVCLHLDQSEGAAEGLELLEDLHAFVDLLNAVNQREVLVVHDGRLQQRLIADLTDLAATVAVAPKSAQDRFKTLMAEADALRWRTPDLEPPCSMPQKDILGDLENTILHSVEALSALRIV